MSRSAVWLVRLGAALRRRWWIVALVTGVVACLALYSFASAPRMYVATQLLTIVVLPPDAATGAEIARVQEDEQTIARMLASGNLLAAPALDDAIAARLATSGGQESGVTARAVAAALASTHSGNVVTLTARRSSAQGARALLAAATAVLMDGALPAALAQRNLLPAGVSVRVEMDGTPSQPMVDSAHASAARGQLLGRIALGVLAGIALALGTELTGSRPRTLLDKP